MNSTTPQMNPTTNETNLYVAIELSEKSWGLRFSDGVKTRDVSSKVADIGAFLEHAALARKRFGLSPAAKLISCHEAGRDGFWLHRALSAAGVQNLVIDSTSIEVDQRMRRVKTDRLDAEKLLRLLLRYCAGEKQALRIVNVPSEEREDERRKSRELERLTHERTGHLTRMRSLLALQGIRVKGIKNLDELRDWADRPLPPNLLRELEREQHRLELLNEQIKQLKDEREAALEVVNPLTQMVVDLQRLPGIGPTSSWAFAEEFFWRDFANRRQVGAAAGLVSAPFNSGNGERDQGITKAGNKRVRTMAVQIAWGWLRWQPDSEISIWFRTRFAASKRSKRVGIIAVARKILIALWRYLKFGVVPKGALLKA